jgi:mannose-6-phosphate isomerase-like protein (cupin superfamily)
VSSTRAWLVGFVLVLSYGLSVGADESRTHLVRRRPGELQWRPASPGAAIEVAPAWLGPGGAHCNFVRYPKGFVESAHHHSADVSGVLVSGELALSERGEEDHVLEAGTYLEIPARVTHTARCGAAAPCVLFTCQPADFDLVPEP